MATDADFAPGIENKALQGTINNTTTDEDFDPEIEKRHSKAKKTFAFLEKIWKARRLAEKPNSTSSSVRLHHTGVLLQVIKV